jgi:hypothetical protein
VQLSGCLAIHTWITQLESRFHNVHNFAELDSCNVQDTEARWNISSECNGSISAPNPAVNPKAGKSVDTFGLLKFGTQEGRLKFKSDVSISSKQLPRWKTLRFGCLILRRYFATSK